MAQTTDDGYVEDIIDLGADIEVTEIPVHHGSPLIGTRIRDSNIREETGANIIGAWIDGELQLPPDPEAIIHPNTVLLVSGAMAPWRRLVTSPDRHARFTSTNVSSLPDRRKSDRPHGRSLPKQGSMP